MYSMHYIKVVTLVFGLMWLLPISMVAQRAREKHIKIEHEYVAGFNMTLTQAKKAALQEAQIKAIEGEFGTVISRSSTTEISNIQRGYDDVKSNVSTVTLGLSDVKGEWIKTYSEEYEELKDPALGLIIIVKLEGLIRERIAAEIDLKALVLRNGLTERNQDDSFYDGDDMYLLFQAPTNGYLVAYLTDASDAYCLLPYQYQTESVMPIKRNQEYVFFSEETAPETMKHIVDEYHLTCGREVELNRIYVIFSPNEFVKAIDESGEGTAPRHLSLEDFHRWLGKARSHDEKMTYRAIDISIRPQR